MTMTTIHATPPETLVQASLFDPPALPPPPEPPRALTRSDTTDEARTATQKFWQFHRANPDVYVQLVRLARQMRARGRAQYGIGSLFEVLRWHRALETEGDPFKLNNNWRSRYARLIAAQEPDLSDFFETRQLRSGAFDATSEREAA